MAKNGIIIPEDRPLSKEEFDEIYSGFIETEGKLDTTADLYDSLPAFIKTLSNFDPTGLSGSISQILSENKAKRESENTKIAIYKLYTTVYKLAKNQVILKDKIKNQIPDLNLLYFEKSKNTYDSKKIEHFKNIWLNSVLSSEETLEEKAYVFEIVSSFSNVEISILSLFYQNHGVLPFNDRNPITVKEISNKLNLVYEHSQQLCIGLSGKGFLHDWGLGKYGYKGPESFVMTDYVILIDKYLSNPV